MRDSGGCGWRPNGMLLVLFETKIPTRCVEPSFNIDPLDESSKIDDADDEVS